MITRSTGPVQPARPLHKGRGYTLIEMMVVMGIILMMVTLVLLSVNSMLRSSRMSRTSSMLIAAIDEARTAAITMRRTTRIDLTRLDKEGTINRLTVFGPGFNENFEGYILPSETPPSNPDPKFVAKWMVQPYKKPVLTVDGSRCLRLEGATAARAYWNPGLRVEKVTQGEYETILQARIKILGNDRAGTRKVKILGSLKEASSSSFSEAYGLCLEIKPKTGGRNEESAVRLEQTNGPGSGSKLNGSGDNSGPTQLSLDEKGGADGSPTARLIENVWYRVILSIKYFKKDGDTPTALVMGKVWVDGQLEPSVPTVGPVEVQPPLDNGYGGFVADGCDAVVDDLLFDMRPIRALPPNLAIDAMKPPSLGGDGKEVAEENTPNNFPLLFRPDGTCQVPVYLRMTDLSTGSKRFVRIDANTGRTKIADSWEDLKKEGSQK